MASVHNWDFNYLIHLVRDKIRDIVFHMYNVMIPNSVIAALSKIVIHF